MKRRARRPRRRRIELAHNPHGWRPRGLLTWCLQLRRFRSWCPATDRIAYHLRIGPVLVTRYDGIHLPKRDFHWPPRG